MAKKKKPKIKETITESDVSREWGFSPYEQQKGMGYSDSPKDKNRKERKQAKQDLKDVEE